jgi:ubiquitin-like modifier-activating enzyme ATG7
MSIPTYKPWASDIELAFYATLGNLKIEKDKLDDSARRVLGLYEIRPGEASERSARMQIQHNSLVSDVYVLAFKHLWLLTHNI